MTNDPKGVSRITTGQSALAARDHRHRAVARRGHRNSFAGAFELEAESRSGEPAAERRGEPPVDDPLDDLAFTISKRVAGLGLEKEKEPASEIALGTEPAKNVEIHSAENPRSPDDLKRRPGEDRGDVAVGVDGAPLQRVATSSRSEKRRSAPAVSDWIVVR